MQIRLENHHLAHGGWQQSGNLFIAGYGHFDEWLLSASDLERVLRECHEPEALQQLLPSLNGCFSFVYKDNTKVVAVVDPCRSIPLFYSDKVVSDTLDTSKIDAEVAGQLAYLEFAQGNKTLVEGWKQIKAGSFVWKDAGRELAQHSYFSHLRTGNELSTHHAFSEGFRQCLQHMSDRLIEGLKGRMAVVPLSGGFDSRCILAMLVKAGYEHIKAFTYGRRDGHEAEIAEKVCDTLGVDWQFVPYDEALYRMYLDDEWDAYLKYAGNGGSVPQEQEYFAVKTLLEGLPNDAVFLPGFCGDVQAGSFIPDVFYEKRWYKNPVAPRSYVFEKLTRFPQEEWLEFDAKSDTADFEAFYDLIEEWVLMERESKYVINGVRCYEYFGFSWMLPLWDKEFIAFWQKVPMALRRDRKLYMEVLNKELFAPLGIVHKAKHFDARFSSGSWQSWLRYVLPKGVKQRAKKLLIPENETEINNLNEFRDILAAKGGIAVEEDTPVNEVVARYYLQLLELERKG